MAPVEQWTTYYIDPNTRIDCGACVPECPYSAIFPEEDVPASYQAKGGEHINHADLKGHYQGVGHHGQAIVLETIRVLSPGEVIDLRDDIRLNHEFHR